MPPSPDRLRPQPKANPDRATEAVRFLAAKKGHPSVYFETVDAFEQSEEGKANNWSIWGIVTGRETRLHKVQKSFKRGAGSSVIYRSETGVFAVLPNDGNRRAAENIMTVDGARKLFKYDRLMMRNIRNALRTNLEHRRRKMIPKKRILYQRPKA